MRNEHKFICVTFETYVWVFPFAIQTLKKGIQRMLVGDKENIISPGIPMNFILSKFQIIISHGF